MFIHALHGAVAELGIIPMTSRIAFSVAVSTVLVFANPASAGSLDWLSNQKYVDCLKGISFLANWNNGHPSTQAEKDAAYDRGRRYCNRQNFPNRPGTDY